MGLCFWGATTFRVFESGPFVCLIDTTSADQGWWNKKGCLALIVGLAGYHRRGGIKYSWILELCVAYEMRSWTIFYVVIRGVFRIGVISNLHTFSYIKDSDNHT